MLASKYLMPARHPMLRALVGSNGTLGGEQRRGQAMVPIERAAAGRVR